MTAQIGDALDAMPGGAAEEIEPLLSINFCAKSIHGPCQGLVFKIDGRDSTVEKCECKCHAGSTVTRQRNKWT